MAVCGGGGSGAAGCRRTLRSRGTSRGSRWFDDREQSRLSLGVVRLCLLGAVTVPINLHLKGDVLHYILDHAGATVLLIEAHLYERIAALRAQLPTLRHLVVRGSDTAPPDAVHWHTALSGARPVDPSPGSATDLHSILYTSGTTGPPKGVMLSHHAYLHSAALFADVMIGATADDVFGTSLPLFHINAQAHTVLPAIYRGTTIA